MLIEQTRRMPGPVRRGLTLAGIMSSVRPLTGPFSASVEVCRRCNFSCLMCPYHSPLTQKFKPSSEDFIDVGLAERVFNDLGEMGTKTVNFGHRGEPMLHPEFAQIARLAANAGLESRVFTNGSLLTERKIEEIIDSGLTTLAVSLVGATPESYVRMHPGESPEDLQRLFDSLDLLRRLKKEAGSSTPKLDLRFITLEDSHQELDEMLNLTIKLGAESLNLFPFRYRSDGDIGTLAPNRESEALAVKRFRELTPKAAAAGIKTNLEEHLIYYRYGPVSLSFPCYAAWIEIDVEVNGNVTFCVRSRTSVGNAKEQSLKDIWLSAKYNELRRLAKDPTKRSGVGQCDCDRCCLFDTNWRVNDRLAGFGLAPKIAPVEDPRLSSPPLGVLSR